MRLRTSHEICMMPLFVCIEGRDGEGILNLMGTFNVRVALVGRKYECTAVELKSH